MLKLTNKRVLLGVTGGIAAYKAAELLRRMQDQGADVRVVMTRGATEFITPLTMQALSGHPVNVELLDTKSESAMGHIDLARWADIILVAPATADFIARLVNGRGDDLLAAICLAADSAVAIAPAMNQAMWSKDSTQANCQKLRNRNFLIFGPDEGIQACGDTGPGRLLEVEKLVEATADIFTTGRLQGKQVVITAGPTREALDPVRYLSNHSSGKQGYAIAEAAAEAGASVRLISGPTNLNTPDRVTRIDVVSADDMFKAVTDNIASCDLFIGVAAVADYKPKNTVEQKIKKRDAPGQHSMTIELTENPDIIASVANVIPKPFTVGFAAETENLLDYARSKMKKKNLDMIIANDVSDASIGFNSDENKTVILWDEEELALPKISKTELARKIINLISQQMSRDIQS